MKVRQIIASLVLCACGSAVALELTPQQAEIERLYAEYSGRLSVPDIRAAEVLSQQGRVLVDVRTVAEREVSMLPGAINVEAYEAMPKAERQNAVIYCTIGVRSGAYVAQLAEEGIASSNLAGGLLSWTHTGGQLLQGKEVVQQAHVYGRRWRLLPDTYEAEWFWWVL